MIPERKRDSIHYPRYEKTQLVPISFWQWCVLLVVANLDVLLLIMAPTLMLPFRTYYSIAEGSAVIAILGILVLPFLFGAGSVARGALARVRTFPGVGGTLSALILPTVVAVAASYQLGWSTLVFHRLIRSIGYLTDGVWPTWLAGLLYFGQPILSAVSSAMLGLVMLTNPTRKPQWLLFGTYGIVHAVLFLIGSRLSHMVYPTRSTALLLSPSFPFWIIGSILDVIVYLLCTYLLVRAFRPSLFPAAFGMFCVSLALSFTEHPSGWYSISARLIALLLVFFVWVSQERFGGMEEAEAT
ncbi:MAG: hypothetical protein GC165_09945 [Armatimonadetes bacterium]|nr:hypothetical protein [Armatimonadota bacterium]